MPPRRFSTTWPRSHTAACHASVAADPSNAAVIDRQIASAPDARADASRLVRPAPPRPAVARAAGRARRSLPRLAQRDHAAADDGRDGGALFRAVSGALARLSQRWPRRRSTTCCMPGRGSAITPARATSMPARKRSAARHGGAFPDTEDGAARAAGHRRLYRGGDRGHRLRPPHDAPVDGNVERVMARLYAVTDAAAGCEARTAPSRRGAGAAATRRRLSRRR